MTLRTKINELRKCSQVLCTFLILAFFSSPAKAQVAGMSTLSILDMPASARAAGVGFDYLSIYGDDLSLALCNPSLITDRLNNQLSVGYVNMFSGANFGSVAYSHAFKNLGAFTFGLQFGSYGRFEGYDENDQPTGTFTAADYVMTIGWGHAVDDHVSIGVNFKPILSQYESYTALALGFDLAATYVSTDKSFASTLMGRNIGAQLMTFDGNAEPLPFELSLVGSYKLQDAPFRLMFAFNELQTWDLAYEDPLNPTSVVDPFTGEVSGMTDLERTLDNLARHVNVGIELNTKTSLFLRLGYSYRQMVEMKAADRFNTSGFSFGIGFTVKGFQFCYSRNNYHLSQAPNYISVTTSLDRFFR